MSMSTPPAVKILVIGLDLGDGRLIREWGADGQLPHLESLLQQGDVASLGTTAEALHVSAWPTLYTGADPGHHGVYYTFQPAPGLQGYRRFGPDQYGVPTFWRLLADAGVRCTVFDAPYTHPEPGASLTQVFDWGTWAHYWKPDSTPRSLLRELNRSPGRYPLGLEAHDLGLVGQDPDEIQPRLLAGVRAKTEAVLQLLERTTWDCFVTAYGETHPGSHYLWWPAPHGSGDRADLKLLLELYQELDRGIGRILSAIPDDVTVFLVTGDGVGPNHSGWHLLPDVLRRLGLLAEPDAEPEKELEEETAGTGDTGKPRWDPVRAVRDLLPKDFRKALARRLPTRLRDTLARRVDTSAIDWARTRAYTLPTDLEGCVRVNLRGREPFGVVEPGAEYERVCDDLTEALLELVNPVTGTRAVREVIRTDRDLPGPRRDYLPDLVVQWSAEAPVQALQSPRIGTVSGPSPDGRTGTHVPPGFLLARGPGISPGSIPEGAHIRDLAPTILSLFGVDRPEHMKGTLLVGPPTPSTR